MSRSLSSTLAWSLGLVLVLTSAVGGPAGAVNDDPVVLDVPAHPASWAHFSGDGTRAAYEVEAYPNRQVYVRDLTTGNDILISAAQDGSPANGFSWGARMSRNGRFVTIQTDAALSGADTGNLSDIYLKDLQTGSLTLASVDGSGQPFGPLHYGMGPAPVSDDGRTVVMAIYRDECNLDTFTNETVCQVADATLYAKDLLTGALVMLDANDADTGFPSDFALSADGDRVAWRTRTSFVADDTDASYDIYVRDLPDGQPELVTVGVLGGDTPSLSADGSRVGFSAYADGGQRAFVRDLESGATMLVSSAEDGTPGDGYAQSVTLSDDGRYAAFASTATNLDPADTDSVNDVYVKDLDTDQLYLASQTGAGVKGDSDSFPRSIVGLGEQVIFGSYASNLGHPGPYNNAHYFAKDIPTGGADTQGPEVVVQFPPVPASGWYTGFPTGTVQVTDPSGVADVYCQPGGARLSDVTGLGTPTVTATVTVEQEGRPQVDCYAVDSLGNWGGEEVDQILQIDTTPPLVQVVFPDPPASGWYTSTPVSGYVNLGDDSLVSSITCTGAVTSDVPALPLQTATARLTVDSEGVHDVSCTATNGAGLSGASEDSTNAATIRIDADADPLVVIDAGVDTATAGAFSDDTNPVTSGSVVNSNGLLVTIADEADPEGVRVSVGSGASTDGSGKATLSVCGMTLRVSAGSEVVLTCGSVIVRTISGPAAEVVLDSGAIVVSVPAGSSAEISDTDQGAQVWNVEGSVTATVNGTTSTIPTGSGTTNLSVEAWVISGFSAPVDNLPTVNTGKAGRAVPLKWHLADADANPITDLATADVTVKPLDCTNGTITDQLETTLAVGSGLLNLGGGNYQLNWKTSTAWAGTCKAMTLDLGGGVTKQAHFKFTK